MVESDSTYLWLNDSETVAISIFIQNDKSILFNCYSYLLDTNESKKKFFLSKELISSYILFSQTNILKITHGR